MIESRRVGWKGHETRMEGEKCTQVWDGGNLKKRDHFGKYKSGREDNIKMNLK